MGEAEADVKQNFDILGGGPLQKTGCEAIFFVKLKYRSVVFKCCHLQQVKKKLICIYVHEFWHFTSVCLEANS